MTTSTFALAITDVVVPNDRQRGTIEEEPLLSLIESIKRLGLINPIIVDEENRLIAGRRRLEACRRLNLSHIASRLFRDLSASDRQLLELDENIRRTDLPWYDIARAVLKIHRLKGESSATWSQERTAEYIGWSHQQTSKYLVVGGYLERPWEEGSGLKARLDACKTLEQAMEVIRRNKDLVLQTALSKDFGEAEEPSSGEGEGSGEDSSTVERLPQPTTVTKKSTASLYNVRQGDFLSWVQGVEYPQWNLIHCDFPYGIGMEKSDQGGSARHETTYEDSPDTFWKLTEALLKNQDRLILSSAHMIFWFSMKYYSRLVEMLEAYRWFVVPHPLIWVKSDGSGIASDYRRRPKHVYETALFCSRGDRQLFQLRNDVVAAPSGRTEEGHLSAKPQAVVEHFLSMVCSGESDLLDPTCGSGSAVRAAQRLGAKSALGLELNKEVADYAALRLQRQLENPDDEE